MAYHGLRDDPPRGSGSVPVPNLPPSPVRSSVAIPRRGRRAPGAEPETPNVEAIEGRAACAGSTSSARAQSDRAWLEEHDLFHPLDYEDVFSRNQRPKVDEYDDYLFVVLQFPVFDKPSAA